MPKNLASLFWTAFLVAELSAFFAGASWSVGSLSGFVISLSFVGAATIGALIAQLSDV